MLRQIDDKIEIKIKQAPISKVAIYNDKIEIIKGKLHPEVIKTFKISSEEFKTRFVSFPMYINNVINSSDRSNLYFLDGISWQDRAPIPEEDMYEDSDLEKYYKKQGGFYEGSCMTLVQQLINTDTLIEFYQKQVNFHHAYQIKIGTVFCCYLILNFNKEDVIYTDYKGNVIDYEQETIETNIKKVINNVGENSKIVGYQKDLNMLVTKDITK